MKDDQTYQALMAMTELEAAALAMLEALERCQRHFKMSIFAEMECHFLLGSIQVLYSLIHNITCRLEARQALIYQLVLGLTGKNGKYNYSKAVHLTRHFSTFSVRRKTTKPHRR